MQMTLTIPNGKMTMTTNTAQSKTVPVLKLDAEEQYLFDSLERYEQRDVKSGVAKILKCANCNKPSFYGAMNLISLAISDSKPACSYKCNKALGQVK